MKKLIMFIIENFLSRSLDLRVRLFNILALSGIIGVVFIGVTNLVIFLGLFPFLFFKMGGYHGGMIAFFIFAVSFTVFMLEGKRALVVSVLEILVYSGLCIFAYLNPESVQRLPLGFLCTYITVL